MEITGKKLLNSAHNIIKNKRQFNPTQDGSTAPIKSGATSDHQVTTGVNSQVLRIQASLNEAQKSQSKEQARLSWLENPQGNPTELRFNSEPLFPDFPANNKQAEFQQNINNKIGELARTLKGYQVEMENVLALNFETAPDLKLDASTLAEAKGISSLDPDRVAHLTQS